MVRAPQDSAPGGNLQPTQNTPHGLARAIGRARGTLRSPTASRTSTKRLEEGVNLLLSHPTGSLLTKQQVGEQQVQHLYGNVLEATFLVPPEVGVHVRAQEVRKLLLDELGGWDAEEETKVHFEERPKGFCLWCWDVQGSELLTKATEVCVAGIEQSEPKYHLGQEYTASTRWDERAASHPQPCCQLTSWTLLSLRTLLS